MSIFSRRISFLGRSIHKENVKSRITKDNKAVKSIIALLNKLESNPFEDDNQELRSIQSGMLACEELVDDLGNAPKDGENVLMKYFKERLFSKEKSIYDKLPRNKRKTFGNTLNPTVKR